MFTTRGQERFLDSEVLVAAGAHGILPLGVGLGVSPVVPVGAVVVGQVTVVVVTVFFVANGVPKVRFWDTTARLVLLPVAATTAVGEVRFPDEDALAEAANVTVAVVVAD